jgi:hypothetical protein
VTKLSAGRNTHSFQGTPKNPRYSRHSGKSCFRSRMTIQTAIRQNAAQRRTYLTKKSEMVRAFKSDLMKRRANLFQLLPVRGVFQCLVVLSERFFEIEKGFRFSGDPGVGARWYAAVEQMIADLGASKVSDQAQQLGKLWVPDLPSTETNGRLGAFSRRLPNGFGLECCTVSSTPSSSSLDYRPF